MEDKQRLSKYTKNITKKTKIKWSPEYSNWMLVNLKDSYYNTLILRELRFDSENQLKIGLEETLFKYEKKNQFLNNLIDYEVNFQNGLCSKYFYILEFYEYNEDNLFTIFDKMKNNNNIFNENDLLHLLYQQVLSNCFLEANNRYNANISLDNIFIDKKNGISKSDQYNISKMNDKINIEINNLKFKNNKKIYCSLKLFNQIIKPNNNFEINNVKESVFNLGLVFLELYFMKEINLFDYEKNKYDVEQLKYYLNQFRNKNSNILIKTICMMLNEDENLRPTFINIFNQLPKYSNYNKNFYLIDQNNHFEEIKGNTIEETKKNNLLKYKNNPDYKLYFDQKYKMFYYYNLKTKECDWIYENEQNKENNNKNNHVYE